MFPSCFARESDRQGVVHEQQKDLSPGDLCLQLLCMIPVNQTRDPINGVTSIKSEQRTCLKALLSLVKLISADHEGLCQADLDK